MPLDLPPEPTTEPERAAVAAFEGVLRRWFQGGEEGWLDLNQTERWLIARELLKELRALQLEIRSVGQAAQQDAASGETQ